MGSSFPRTSRRANFQTKLGCIRYAKLVPQEESPKTYPLMKLAYAFAW